MALFLPNFSISKLLKQKIYYLIKKPRHQLSRKYRSLALGHSPQKKGVCVKLYTVAPKKPNSAKRKVAQVKLSTKKIVLCYIQGEGHNLVNFNSVLVRGGRIPDLPGIKYVLIRGVYDLKSVRLRRHGRSKYGTTLDFKGKIEYIKFPKRAVKKKISPVKSKFLRLSLQTVIE